MEAATPLRTPHVRTVGGDRVAVDGLLVDDETAVRLVREREEAGEDAVALVLDALEIGARVLDREQTGANADFVKAEFEKAARELEADFGERARAVTESMAQELERRFSDGSTDAVQHRVRAAVDEVMAKSREELARQFSADDGRNPLAAFQKSALTLLKQSADQQDANLRAMHAKMSELEKELQRLRDQEQKQLELAEERERGTAKGRTYEEAVADAIDDLAARQGDDCDAVGDVMGTTRKTGDIVVGVDAARGPARGRVVFEAKNAKLSKPEAMRELDRGRSEREADYAVLVVPDEEKLPARTEALREYNGDKLLAVYDPEDSSPLGLELAYRLARARVLMARGGDEGVDVPAVAETVERALGAMEDVRSIKQKLTGAQTSIRSADDLLEGMAATVRAHLTRIDELLAAGGGAN
jgi:hypothetical protein